MPTGRDTIEHREMRALDAKAWQYALRAEVFGYAEIADEIGLAALTATTIVRGWQDAGRVRLKRHGGQTGPALFEVAPAYREPTDRASQVRQQLWTAMRGLRTFSPVDLVAHCVADLRVEGREASGYCQALLRAGYLAVGRKASPAKWEARYQLVRNTGPRAPRERRITSVWDPNEGAFTYLPGELRKWNAR